MSFWNSDANHSIEEIIAEIGKTKNISVEMTHGGEICGHPNLRLIYKKKNIDCHEKSLLSFVSN